MYIFIFTLIHYVFAYTLYIKYSCLSMPLRCLSVQTPQIFRFLQGERCSQWPLALNLLAFAFRPLAFKNTHTEVGEEMSLFGFEEVKKLCTAYLWNDKYGIYIYLFDDAWCQVCNMTFPLIKPMMAKAVPRTRVSPFISHVSSKDSYYSAKVVQPES